MIKKCCEKAYKVFCAYCQHAFYYCLEHNKGVCSVCKKKNRGG